MKHLALILLLFVAGCLSTTAARSGPGRWLVTAENGSGAERARALNTKATDICPHGFAIVSPITTTTATASMYIACSETE